MKRIKFFIIIVIIVICSSALEVQQIDTKLNLTFEKAIELINEDKNE